VRAFGLIAVLCLGCGRTRLYEPVHAPVCPGGAVTGRICAPDSKTWLNGADVWIEARDCSGKAVKVSTVSGADGAFELDAVPPGPWTVSAALGSFTQATPVVVVEGAVTQVPENQLCIAQKDVRIAIVDGAGDRIEDLLQGLGLHVTLFHGRSGQWLTDGALFLSDLSWMQQFDIIFIDCAAASAPGSQIDFGPHAQEIEDNLRTYVQQGGSIYASDWSLVFAAYAAPDVLSAQGVTSLASPLSTPQLEGFAPQLVSAAVVDDGLKTFLGKGSVEVNFPASISVHWGLLGKLQGGAVLVRADGVQACEEAQCSRAGASLDSVPLAVSVKVTPAGQRGGRVLYTSFHNIQQNGDDVAKMLKYLVLHL
jgi:hypothetical protein